jgi:hypothetical protein
MKYIPSCYQEIEGKSFGTIHTKEQARSISFWRNLKPNEYNNKEKPCHSY